MPVHDWTRVVAGVFHDFHQRWIGAIRDALNDGLLPENYYALSEQVAEGPHPDVVALQEADSSSAGGLEQSGAVAVLDQPPRVRFTDEMEREVYATTADRVAVYHASGDRVVAFIEIVSPGNKHSQYELAKFLDKLDEGLQRGCHLLVIDVLPPGRHEPRGMLATFWERHSDETHTVTTDEPCGLAAYRADVATNAYFEPVGLGKPLPEMPLFLTADHYVNVPLEATYEESWRGVPQRWKRVIENEADEHAN